MGMFKTLVKYVWLTVSLCLATTLCYERKNVLFLMADDLRVQLGAMHSDGIVSPKMYTPNLDKLAARSVVFQQAYVQQALCGPSRTSILTGRRPDTTHVYNAQYWRKVTGNLTTIPQYFKANGYESIGVGKIFHPYKGLDKNDPVSWSNKFFHAKKTKWEKNQTSWIAVPDSELKFSPLVDEQIANQAVSILQGLSGKLTSHRNSSTGFHPFFLAVGFHRPHLPFVFPASLLKYYPESEIQLPQNGYAPINLPDVAWSTYPELRNFNDIRALRPPGNFNTSLPDKQVLELRRAYYSSVTWMDSQVGRVLDELEKSGLAEDTIIVFLGDHGWQLGEHAQWCKHTNFELAVHSPLLIRIPGLTDSGVASKKLVEFVDIFPTLVEAAGLPKIDVCPKNSRNIEVCHEGASLMPLIQNPQADWKKLAFSQFPRVWEGHDVMGYTLKTQDGFRYTEWVKFYYFPDYKPDWTEVFGVELYDHSLDPEENYNLVDESSYASVKESLRQKLRAGWRKALPSS